MPEELVFEVRLGMPVGMALQDARAGLERTIASAGVGYRADMRLFCDRGIPCVLFGPSGIRMAHAVDEPVQIADLVAVGRVAVRGALAFATAWAPSRPGAAL